MKREDELFGARSGIQKAIRRGDIDLAKTCFDLLWSEKSHQTWLKWRITVLVNEESWWLIGELSDFLSLKTAEEKDWRKFIYQLVICRKSKDSGGLASLPKHKNLPKEISNHTEIKEMKKYLDMIEKEQMAIEDVADIAHLEMKEKREYSDYEKRALGLLRGRAHLGGMDGDKLCCIATMILIFNRGLDKKLVQLKMKEDQKEFLVKKTGKPKRIKLPWFIFDMHTAKGKWAWNIFMKRNHGTKIDKDNIKFLWFHLESGTIPLDKINYKMKIEDKPLPTDTIWWQQLMKRRLSFDNREAKSNKKLWDDEFKKQIKGLVEWCLSRDE